MTPIQVDDAINEAVENVAYVNNLSSDSSLVLVDAESLGGLPAENYATKNYVVDTINQAQLGGDNNEVDLSIYATKDDLTLVRNAIPTTPEDIGIDYPVDSVNGKTGTVSLSASDVGALPISGGKLTGELNINDGITFRKDTEGGNIQIKPPSGKTSDYWEMDAHDGHLKFHTMKNASDPNGAGSKTAFKIFTDGSIDTGNNAKTRERLGAAPSGYGLGNEYARSLNSTSDLNLITQNGWYSWLYNSIPKNAPTDNNLFLDNMFVMGSGASCIQLVFDTQNNANTGTILKRVNYGEDYFSNWEYINPPMLAGISYRTTERYRGRPVFMIAVNLGNTPAAGATKDIPHGIPDVETVIDYWGTYANQQAIFNNDNIDTILVTPTVVRVKMSSAAGNGGYNLSMVFKYIKNGI